MADDHRTHAQVFVTGIFNQKIPGCMEHCRQQDDDHYRNGH
jgi:hypothetical protein